MSGHHHGHSMSVA